MISRKYVAGASSADLARFPAFIFGVWYRQCANLAHIIERTGGPDEARTGLMQTMTQYLQAALFAQALEAQAGIGFTAEHPVPVSQLGQRLHPFGAMIISQQCWRYVSRA